MSAGAPMRTGAPAIGGPLPPVARLHGSGQTEIAARVVDAGAGEPVVFLHGLAGLNEHWEEVASRVSTGARCILFELPLLDLTGDDCSVGGVVGLTVEFLRRYVGRPAVLVGNSFGGHVALRIAIEHPSLVRGLVLAGASGLIERSIVSGVQIRPTRAWLEEKIAELFYDRSCMRSADVDRAHRELSRRPAARAMVRLSRSARRDHLGDRVGAVRAPTLLIWGREDVVTPPQAAAMFAAGIRGSRLVWFDRCGHTPMIEHPDAFAGALAGFLAGLGR